METTVTPHFTHIRLYSDLFLQPLNNLSENSRSETFDLHSIISYPSDFQEIIPSYTSFVTWPLQLCPPPVRRKTLLSLISVPPSTPSRRIVDPDSTVFDLESLRTSLPFSFPPIICGPFPEVRFREWILGFPLFSVYIKVICYKVLSVLWLKVYIKNLNGRSNMSVYIFFRY